MRKTNKASDFRNRRLRLRTAVTAASLLACAVLATGTATAGGLARITGHVHDSAGAPLAGALVAVQPSDAAFRERLVFTDRAGAFSVTDLDAGEYRVRVTKSSFLPAVAAGVRLAVGADLALTVNLQTAIDIVSRGIRRGSLEEMKWVLRSSPSTRPIIRFDEEDQAESLEAALAGMDSEGYFRLYSTTVETTTGTSDVVGSQFSFRLPLALNSQVTFSGQYTEDQGQPRGFGAQYEFSSRDRQKSAVAVHVRQGAILNGLSGGESREIKLQYGEQVQWSDNLVFNYGAAIGRVEGVAEHNYLRPQVGFVWVPEARTTFQALFSRQAPIDASDPVRGREYFDRTVYIPPALEQYSHIEAGAAHTLSENTQVSAAVFRDILGTQAFLIDAEDGRRAIMIFDGADTLTKGVRLHVDQLFRNFEAGLGYVYANAVGFEGDVVSPDALGREASRGDFHVLTARMKTDIDLTQTAITAVYRWTSGFPLAPIDPYQTFAEFNDPTLNITITQDLPALKMFPGKFQAILDARNLFEPSFGSRRTVQASYPRLLKGGIHIEF